MLVEKIHYYTPDELKAIRKKLGITQGDFWKRFGVTQSGGSRYESGRDMPDPVQILLNIALARPTASAKIVDRLRK